jgi:ABC-type branched-subunit amino acid transport system ATPase component
VGHIPRTASGKVQRFRLKSLTPELSIVENMVAAHCKALADPEVVNKARVATVGKKRKASTNTQAFMDALELSNARIAKRRCDGISRRQQRDVPIALGQ